MRSGPSHGGKSASRSSLRECAPACIRPITLDLTDKKSFAALRSLLEQERAIIRIIINNAA
ncbi:MAG: hypothetical protein LKE27_10505 [Atopobiaceae bacterium]|nr:hypothetical protein [Atopobiaceae bacterium]